MPLPPPEDLLEQILHSLVDDPSSVRISKMLGEQTTMFEIHVSDKDFGKLVGRHYAHVEALRCVFGAIYGKQKRRLQIEVIEPHRR